MIDRVFVTTFGPLTGKGCFGFAAVVPIHQRRAGAVDLQFANVAYTALAAIVAHNAQCIAWNRTPGCAVTYFAWPVA